MLTYGLIGEKLGHSFSVPIHVSFGNPAYVLKEIPKDELKVFMEEKAFKGLNVTIPYKQDVMPYCILDEAAAEIGAVNTIVNKNGELYGYNTDAFGLSAMMDLAMGQENVDFSGKKAVILGGGGTAKTATYVLSRKNAKKITLLVRDVKKASPDFAGKNVEIVSISEIPDDIFKETEILINTTPVGMYPIVDASPVDIEKFESLCGVFDVVYNPLCTKLVGDARKLSIPAANGLYMLVMQALKAEWLFHEGADSKEDFKLMPALQDGERLYNDLVANLTNIVFVGMPGSGKTTMAKKLAGDLKREYTDTDDEFVKDHNMTPAECIEKNGEADFRVKETMTVKKTALKNRLVIATGGGVVTRPENVEALKQNGKVVYIKRDIENLSSFGRPLSQGDGAIEKLYESRKKLYEEAADVTVEVVEGDIEATAARVKKALNIGG